jgi:TIR domain/Pentapeptide repeats (8 copies)
MDREEALKLLKAGRKGIDEWNRRRKSGEIIPSLRRANLSRVNLSRVNLRGANLHGANLSVAKLDRADLSDAHLNGADLSYATFFRTRLWRANLCNANLSCANLCDAKLARANFSNANLSDAEFRVASCNLTVFANVDLSKAKSLDSICHWSPSTIGIDTLFRSKGRIPEAFLRGCGVPESVIVNRFDHVGAMEPIQFYSCFISYSSNDQAFADRLHARMVQEKLRVWYAPEKMKGGRKVFDQVVGAIQVQDKLMLVLSEHSMQSGWVETELRAALEREQREARQVLFPIRIASWESVRDWKCFDSNSGRDLADVVRSYHIPDFSNWKEHDSFEKAFAGLFDDLRAEESTGTGSNPPPSTPETPR